MIKLNKGDYQLGFAYLLIASIWLLFRFSSEGVLLAEMLIDILVYLGKMIASFFLFKFLVERFILQSKRYFLFCLCFVSGVILLGIVVNYLGQVSARTQQSFSFHPISGLIVDGLYTIVPDITLFLGIIFSKKYYDQELENKNLEIENQENKVRLLNRQFSPHFLFNNLNTIDSLIDSRPKVAKEYVKHLSLLYRKMIQNKSSDLIALGEEIDFIKSYIFLIETRFPDTYEFSIIDKRKTHTGFLPNGSLQTLLENVVKHNDAQDDKKVLTELLINDTHVRVSNNKLNSTKPSKTRSGLHNLRSRYQILTDKDISIVDSAEFFAVKVPLINVNQEK